MRRDQVLHVARAAARIAGVRRVLVVGGQAVLGTHTHDRLPAAAIASLEADVVVLDDLHGTAAQVIDGAIGYMSRFHTTHGYYVDGVQLSELTLPAGWQGRVLTHTCADHHGEVDVHFLALADLVATKLGAGRPQDRRFVQALADHRDPDGRPLVDLEQVRHRADALPEAGPERARALALVDALERGTSIVLHNPPT